MLVLSDAVNGWHNQGPAIVSLDWFYREPLPNRLHWLYKDYKSCLPRIFAENIPFNFFGERPEKKKLNKDGTNNLHQFFQKRNMIDFVCIIVYLKCFRYFAVQTESCFWKFVIRERAMGPNKNMTQKNCLRSFFKVSHSSITIFKKFFEEEKFLRITKT